MKKMIHSIMTATLAMGLAACGGSSDEPESRDVLLRLDKQTINAPAEGLQTSFALEAEEDWKVYADDQCKEWVTMTPENGTRSTTVSVSIAKNTDYTVRQGRIVAMSGTSRAVIDVTQAAAERPAVDSSIKGPDGYELAWNDEFSEGTTLGSSWTHEVKPAGWVNNELQAYVNGTSPKGDRVTEIADGTLRIHCFKEDGKIYSGRVYAKVNQGWQYGYFEASIKLPKGKGTWPAFWMMPVGNDWNTNPWPMCGEIDIMEEVGVVPNEVSSSIHTQDYNHTKNTQKTHAMTIAGAEGGFHTYALLWTADEITTYVDGKVQLHVTKDVLGSGHNQWPFHYAFYPIFNLAWGGSWGGMQGVDESALPITMEVDYIRVFQKQ